MSELKKAIESLGAVRKQLDFLFEETQKMLALTQALYVDLDEHENQYGFVSGEALLTMLEERLVSAGVSIGKLSDPIRENIAKLSEIEANKDLPPVKKKEK